MAWLPRLPRLPRLRTRTIVRVAVDVGLPIAAYYGLRLAGAGVYPFLIAGSLLSAASALVSLVPDRRLDGMATYMLVMMLGSMGMSLLHGGTRFLLAEGRPSDYQGLTGTIENRLLFSRRTGQQRRPAVHR